MKKILLLLSFIMTSIVGITQNPYYIEKLLSDDILLFDTLRSNSFVGGFTGNGWLITKDGKAEFDEVTVRKSLKAYELVLQKIRSVNGGIVVSAGNADVDSVSGGPVVGYTIFPKDTAITLVVNDIVRVQTWSGGQIKYYVGVIGSVDYATNSFWMSEAGFVGSDRPAANDEMVQFGNLTDPTRQGLIYITAHDTQSPYMDVLDGVNSASLPGLPKVRIGKLDGIISPTFGQLHGYGIYGSDVYLEGTLADSAGVLYSHHFAVTDSSFSVLYSRLDSAETIIQEHETRFLMTPDSISLTAVWDSINLISGNVRNLNTAYEQTASAILLKANKSTTDSLGMLLDSAYARIALMPDSISLTTVYLQLDSIGGEIDSIWTRIALTPDSISLQAVKDSLNALGEKVDLNSAQLVIQASQIASKVSNTTYTSDMSILNSRMSSAESSITQQADLINSKVSTTTYTSGLATKENSVSKSSSAPVSPVTGQLWINTSVTPNTLYRYSGSAWVKVTPTTAAEVAAFSSADGVALSGRVTTAESSITQLSNSINLKVSQADFDLLTGRVTTAESNITQTSEDVTFGFSRIGVGGYTRTGKTVIDATGLTVYDGGIKIKNNIGTDVLSADVNGNLSITGNINATTGTLGTLTMGSGGKIDLPPTWGGQAGRLDASGLHMAYSSTQAQSIEWYNSLGTWAGNIYPNSSGYLNIVSDFGLNIDATSAPINIGNTGLSGDISIGNTLRKIQLSGSSIIGLHRQNYDPGTVSVSGTQGITTSTNLIVITSSTSSPAIHNISYSSGSPQNGDILHVLNTSENYVDLRSPVEVTGSNIRVQENKGHFRILAYSHCTLIYYGGYWYCHMDGQQ